MNDLHRRDFLRLAGAGAAAFVFPSLAFAQEIPLEELTIAGMRRYPARQLTEAYLARIARLDERLNSIIELNPDALVIAGALDRERAAGRTRGPMRTFAGSLALAESIAKNDAHIVRRLREAGAVLLGKTNLSEWANFRSTRSTSGWSARGGLTRNPYALDRNCCGSSSGTGAAIAASLAAVGVGTDATAASRGHAHADYTQFLDPNGLRGEVLLYEFKHDLNAYLAQLSPNVQARTLTDLIEFNEDNREREMPYFGQELFLQAQEKGPLTTPAYEKALAKNRRLSRTMGIDAVLKKHRLDALVAPTGRPVWTTDLVNGDHYGGGYSSASAVSGYPHVTVPAGDVFGLPVAFEQATKARKTPTLPSGPKVVND